MKELFKSDLVNMQVEVKDSAEFFSYIGEILGSKNLTHDTFSQAITTREMNYPTGLQLENFAVAIPHTDTKHIVSPFVSINHLVHPITFYQMGTDDVEVEVQDIFVLGIKNPKEQVGLLAQLMELFGTKTFVEKYKKSTTSAQVIDLINEYL